MSTKPDDSDQCDEPQAEASENLLPVPAVASPRPLRITSRDEAMGQLSQLPMLVLTGIITTNQSNAIRASSVAIINGHDRAEKRDSGGDFSPELVVQLRKYPEMANALAAFLPQGVVDRLMQGD